MAEILSQSQIDALLASLSTGETKMEEEPHKKVKEYDFRSPKRFTREQLKWIDGIYQNYSRRLSSYLSGVLRVFCETEIVQLEEQKFYEFNNALEDSVLLANINIHYEDEAKLDDQLLLMEVSKPISYSIIDRLLGGNGSGYQINREYTEIELSILQNLFNQIIPLMREPWNGYFKIDPKLRKIDTNSRLGQAMDADETVLIITIRIKVEELDGLINFCMSGTDLSSLLKQHEENVKSSSKKERTDEEEKGKHFIMNSIEDGELELAAYLGNAHIDLTDILQLQVGDVIELNQNVQEPVVITVGGTPWFSASLGVKKRKKAVKILDKYSTKRGWL